MVCERIHTRTRKLLDMIISILNLKGGVGKTTSAIGLATAAARDGRDVRVYDCDPQSSASLWAEVAAERGDELPFEVESANIVTVRKIGKKFKGDPGVWAFIDCPPNGHVADEAMSVADLVVVPTTSGPADIAKTFDTAETVSGRGIFYAILLNRVAKGTLTLKGALGDFERRNASYFETMIPRREALATFFGNAFGDELFGYAEVFEEIKGALDCGD